jgi:hypothetical protein
MRPKSEQKEERVLAVHPFASLKASVAMSVSWYGTASDQILHLLCPETHEQPIRHPGKSSVADQLFSSRLCKSPLERHTLERAYDHASEDEATHPSESFPPCAFGVETRTGSSMEEA